ncbi:hypothetical protein JW916_06810 [Candidatus Sumerlaeota bacterium]|nr:hypothetical protein [Candidatus Sumerlaeota bacterium]
MSEPLESGSSEVAAGKSRDRRAALCVGLSLFAFYLLTTSARSPCGDEYEYAGVAMNLVAHRRPVVTVARNGPDGRPTHAFEYSKFPLGQSVLLLPFAWAATALSSAPSGARPAFGILAFNALPAAECAAIGTLVFLLFRLSGRRARKLRLTRGQSALASLVTGGATQLWPSASTLFADTSGALLLTASVYGLARFRYRRGATFLWGVAAAWSVALAFLCKSMFALVWPAVAVYGVWALIERRRTDPKTLGRVRLASTLALAVLPFVLAATAQLAWNHARYGSPWTSGYHRARDGDFGFNTPLWVGLYGIFLSSGRSFFLYSPLCLLGLFGLRSFWRHARAETILLLGMSAPLTLAYAKWWAWYAGIEWGARFFLFLVPFLAWTSAPVWRKIFSYRPRAFERYGRKTAATLLIAVSAAIQIPGVALHPAAYWQMTLSEARILEHPIYQKGVWEIRDDMFLVHFVPEFSPVVGQTWMLWATLNRDRLDDAALSRSIPWRLLNPKWTPARVKPYLVTDVWLWNEWRRPGVSKAWLAAAAGVLASLLAIGLLGLWSSVRSFKRPSFDLASGRGNSE